MNTVFTFVATYWYAWLIVTVCSFGAFFSAIDLHRTVRDAWEKIDESEDKGIRADIQESRALGKKMVKEQIPKMPLSQRFSADLAHLGTKVFGALLIASLVLKLLHY